MMPARWIILLVAVHAAPYRPYTTASLDCVATVNDYLRTSHIRRCAKSMPYSSYRLHVNELMTDCLSGEDLEMRVVVSKIKQVMGFAYDGECRPWHDDIDSHPPSLPLPP